MESWRNKILRFIYQHLFLIFTAQIREPYIIRVDHIFPNASTNELYITFHIANKRVSQEISVAEFVKSDMIYLVDPRVVFDIGQQFGGYAEKLDYTPQKQRHLKEKCVTSLKRVFIDE